MRIFIAIILLSSTAQWTSTATADDSVESLIQSFSNHCLKCHGLENVIEGDVDLTSFRSSKDLLAAPQQLEHLIQVLQDRQMPPEEQPQLPKATRQSMIDQLQATLNTALKSLPFKPTPIRRMTRFQYNNAVVDLLELDRDIFQLNERLMRRRDDYFRPVSKQMPKHVRVSSRPLSKDIDNQRTEGFRGVAAFPQDKRAEHGFDNRADHLTLSPLLMESFLKLSQTIVESPDLNPKECRSWDRLFAPPGKTTSGPDDGKIVDVDAQRKSYVAAIRDRLQHLLRRAFRRPVAPETLDRFTNFAESQLASGVSFEQTMRTIVGTVIGMPEFLYLYEQHEKPLKTATNNGRVRIDDFELATRLSQFFWSSIPDDELLDLAESGKLSDPNVLSQQIDRMMNDRRSSRYCENFPSQWLQLDRLVTSIPDPQRFAYFYYNGYRTSMHMMSEPLLLFETIYVEDRPILELLDSDYTWESTMLRANYDGRSNAPGEVQVQTFRRVSLDSSQRGGVITTAAIMTMTSTPVRTQPITRGAWINAVIFNDPPEPPPADVPPLPEPDAEELAKLTIRERLAVHRQRADCAGCHNKIDPLGFALENYGPTGVWRDKYGNGRDVDPSGVLFNQYPFETAGDFKQLIVREKDRFYRGFIAHLLSYAFGRELGPADSPSLDKMTQQAVEEGDNLRAVLKRIAMSEPFLHHGTWDEVGGER